MKVYCHDHHHLLICPLVSFVAVVWLGHGPGCRTYEIATRFWVVVICPIIKCLTVLEFSFIKSPSSGVSLCFQSVSATSASAAAKTFPSHIKTVRAKPLIFGTKNIWVCGNVLDDLSMTLTQGHGCGIHLQKFTCLRDKVRTTYRITTKLSSFVALVMVITWLDFGAILLKTVILAEFLEKLRMCFFKVNTILAISQEWLVRLMWNEKEVYWLDTGYNMWPSPLTSLMTLTMDVSRSNFEIALSPGLLVWLMLNEKESS